MAARIPLELALEPGGEAFHRIGMHIAADILKDGVFDRLVRSEWLADSAVHVGVVRHQSGDLDLAPEEPTLLICLIAYHREQFGYGASQLSKIVHLYADEFQRMYGPRAGLRLVG